MKNIFVPIKGGCRLANKFHRRFTALSPHFFMAVPPFYRTFSGIEATNKLSAACCEE
jgi:hypothetical protein